MKYIIASDFDGTLSQGGISEETLDAIKEFRRRGNFFGVVTGRDFHWSYEIFKENDMFPFDFIISNNGGQGCDENGECIFRDYIENVPYGKSTVAQEMMKSNLSLSGIDSGIALEKTRLAFHPDLPDGGRVEGEPYDFLPISSLQTLDRFVSSNVICENDEAAQVVAKKLSELYGEYINPSVNGRCIDITRAGTDKATAVAKVAEYFGVPTENIYTAGDNYNDMQMLKTYHGCAMTGGVEAIKKIAEYTCDNVAEVVKIVLNKGL